MPQADVERTARVLVEARRAARALPDFPGVMPEALADGYAIQRAALRLAGRAIVGWKVGRVPAPLIAAHGVDRIAGPVLEGTVAHAEGDELAMPVFADGFAAAEAEFLLRVGRVPGPGEPLDNGTAERCINAVHVGIEIASSPFPGVNDNGPAVTVADFGNNAGLVVGPPLLDRASILELSVALLIDGREAGRGEASSMLDGPFGAARFLFELAAAGVITMRPGQWISSGAVTGVHRVRPGDRVEVRFGDQRVACSIISATASTT